MAELSEKIKKMPKFVQEAMASGAEINAQIGKKYNLSIEEIGDMVYIIAHTILKDITLKDFPRRLREKLRLSPVTAKVIALDIALKKFLPLKKHLVGIEDLIVSLGGEVPEKIPKPPAMEEVKPTPPPSSLPRKPEEEGLDIKTALGKNSEIGKQMIGRTPIKIEGFEQPVKPSIKNWLADYTQQLGTSWHSSVERSKYLFRSPNTQNLTEEERMILGQILKSFDEDSPLPISAETGLLVLPESRFTPLLQKAGQEERRGKPEEEKEEEAPPEIPKIETKSEKPTPIRPPVVPEVPEIKAEPERPPKLEESGPRIKGNVVDLKNE